MYTSFPLLKYIAIIAVAAVIIILVVAIPGPYIGLRYAPGVPFTIVGPDVLIQGEQAVVVWDSSPENTAKYPADKIELCPFKYVDRGCITINASTQNDGSAQVGIPSTVEPGSYYIRLTARNAQGELLGRRTDVRQTEVRKATMLLGGDKIRIAWDNDVFKHYPKVKVEFCTVKRTCYLLSDYVSNTGKSPQITIPSNNPADPGAIRVRARTVSGLLALQRVGQEIRLVDLPAVIIKEAQLVADARRTGQYLNPVDDRRTEDNDPKGGDTKPIDDKDNEDNQNQNPNQSGQTDDNCINDETVVRALTADGIFSETNRHRARKGLPALKRNAQLEQAAQAKRDHMIRLKYIAHDSPDGKKPYDFIKEAGYSFSSWGENLARGTFAGDIDLVRRWVCSPSHAANIFGQYYPFKDLGVAVGQGDLDDGRRVWYAVQMFGDPKLSQTPTPTPGASSSPSPSTSPTPSPSPSLSPSPTPPSTTASFPGAQGYGATATGGRGGKIIEVTNLNDSGDGSLRAAIESAGARIVVFKVGGIITLQNELNIVNPNITIAGQTAPGPGITIRYAATANFALRISTSNVIIRYLRVRLGESNINGDSIHVNDGSSYVIIDHSSMSWATDENLDIYSWQGLPVQNITAQNSIIGQALDTGDGSAKGSLISGLKSPEYWRLVSNVDLHHNVFVHNTHRNPRVVAKNVKVINNVVYNWLSRAGESERDVVIDWIGNYFLRGPMSSVDNDRLLFHATTSPDRSTTYRDASIYIAQNLAPDFGYTNPSQDNWGMIKDHYVMDGNKRAGIPTRMRRASALPNATVPITIDTPGNSMMNTLLTDAGASKRLNCDGSWANAKDPIDERLTNDITNKRGPKQGEAPATAAQASGGYTPPTSNAGCTDTDKDGMPDAWEQANTFSSTNATDGPQDADGDSWTNVEEYLNGTNPRVRG